MQMCEQHLLERDLLVAKQSPRKPFIKNAAEQNSAALLPVVAPHSARKPDRWRTSTTRRHASLKALGGAARYACPGQSIECR